MRGLDGRCSGYELDRVLNIIRRFPCIEKLYVVFLISILQFHRHNEMDENIEPQYDRLHPIQCLQTHHKTVVFEIFVGHDKQLQFAKFFVFNAKVQSNIEYEVMYYGAGNSVSLAYQHTLLRVEIEVLEMLNLNSGVDITILRIISSSIAMICQWLTPLNSHIQV
ncbi:hypothetical protein ZWY2020_016881 [Hordeum vulgare]|nr:hypothetical protein ZWY2020_016881 [Hordeum vulgare]